MDMKDTTPTEYCTLRDTPMIRKLKNGQYVQVEFVFQKTERWYDESGQPHRDNGLPAVLSGNGHEVYYMHGKLIRNKYATGVLEYIDDAV